MRGAAASHAVAPVRILITNEGTHSTRDWAIATAQMLVSEGQNISPRRLDALQQLRSRIVATLTEAFEATPATASTAGICAAAQIAVAQIVQHSKESPWELEFSNPDIQAMMEDVVRRNLHSNADIALRTE